MKMEVPIYAWIPMLFVVTILAVMWTLPNNEAINNHGKCYDNNGYEIIGLECIEKPMFISLWAKILITSVVLIALIILYIWEAKEYARLERSFR